MKIALVAIVENKNFGQTKWLGLGYLKAVLDEKHDVDVKLFGIDELDSAVFELTSCQYDIIGVSILQFNFYVSIELINRIGNDCESIVVVGNIVPSLFPQTLLSNRNIDYVIIGEGEITFQELCVCLEQGLSVRQCSGIAYIENGIYIETAPREPILEVDSLPFPYRVADGKSNVNSFGIIGSRGCDGTCTFCDSKIIHGHRTRTRTIENIMLELDDLMQTNNCKIVSFYDSTFCTVSDKSGQRLKLLLNALRNRQEKLFFDLNMRSEQFNENTIKTINQLCEVGLYCLLIGFEAGNDEDLRLYGKQAKVSDHKSTLALLRDHGYSNGNTRLFIDWGFINFNPYSSIDKLTKNLDFLSTAGFFVTFPKLGSRLMISGGAPICKRIQKDNLLKTSLGEIIIDPYGYNFVNPEIQEIYDLAMYCAKTAPRIFNPEFAPHYIIYKRISNSSKYDDDYRLYAEKSDEISRFAIDTMFDIISAVSEKGGISTNIIKKHITKFYSDNENYFKRIRSFQHKIYMLLQKEGYLMQY